MLIISSNAVVSSWYNNYGLIFKNFSPIIGDIEKGTFFVFSYFEDMIGVPTQKLSQFDITGKLVNYC